MQTKKILMLGPGAWGTALALHLSRLGHSVHLWGNDAAQLNAMQAHRCNTVFLPAFPLPDSIFINHDLKKAVAVCQDIVIAVPSVAFVTVLMQLKPFLREGMRLLWVTKGLDGASHRLLHEVFEEILSDCFSYGILSGPSFAAEVAAQKPTAVALASRDPIALRYFVEQWNSDLFRVFPTDDIVGVQVGSAVKNVIAIAVGLVDGMRMGANMRCAVMTRGLAEMADLGVALGARRETFMGLSGLGDLVLTCSDDQSRNRRFGLALGQGGSISAIQKEIGHVIEGSYAAEQILYLAKQYRVAMPISQCVKNLLSEVLSPKEALAQMMKD